MGVHLRFVEPDKFSMNESTKLVIADKVQIA